MKKQDVASAVFALAAASTFAFLFARLQQLQPHIAIWGLATGIESLALALAPGVLFERVTYDDFRNGKWLVRYGYAALASKVAGVLFIIAAGLWAWSVIK